MLSLASKTLLFPYFLTLKLRHFLYDKNIKKSRSFTTPVICVGNITVGGTGKTPHTEMLIRHLRNTCKIAVLSRGYKRKSKGFRIAEVTDTFKDVGDEPLQIKQKFTDITVAVCKNRCEGIEKLQEKAGVIILDDGFQHRKVKPKHSIVLVNYNNPIYNDNLLPLGSLRDLPEQIKRADTVIISKSPVAIYTNGIMDNEATMEEVAKEERAWRSNLNLTANQKLYFSIIEYGAPLPVFYGVGDPRYIYSGSAIYFTGIANDNEFKDNLLSKYKVLGSLKFADHRNFSKSDIRRINNWAKENPTAVIFTTEKDSKRLLQIQGLDNNVKIRLFYIPIEVSVVPEIKKEEFITSIKKLID